MKKSGSVGVRFTFQNLLLIPCLLCCLLAGATSAFARSRHTNTTVPSGGSLDPVGFSQSMQGGTLSLGNFSTMYGLIDSWLVTSIGAEVSWADSTGIGLVSLDQLRTGSDVNGLTFAQLATIDFNPGIYGSSVTVLDGNAPSVPEPGTISLFALGAASLMMARKRRTAGH